MVTICLGRRLPGDSSDRYPRARRAALSPEGTPSYLVLLRAGFAWPAGHPAAGGLLPHHFTLTRPRLSGDCRGLAVSFLWHFPSGRPDWVLPSALLCGARTFLQRYSLRRRSPVRLGPSKFYPDALGFLTRSSSAMFTSLSAPRFSSRPTCLTVTVSPKRFRSSVACLWSSFNSGSFTFHLPLTCSTTSFESR